MKRTGIFMAIAAAAVIGVSAIGVARHASAQEPGDGTPTAEAPAGAKFKERVAEKLGISAEQLDQAIDDAALDAVNDAEQSGTITPEQADKARERIENGKGLGLFDRIREHRQHHRQALVRRGIINSAAAALNMTPEELVSELKAGNSIADVASDRSVSLDDVKAQITGDATAKLDELVAKGRITQERADAALAKLTDHLEDILNKSRQRDASQ